MSKAKAGRIEMEEAAVDVADVVDWAMKMVRKRADNAAISLAMTVPSGLPRLCADERRCVRFCSTSCPMRSGSLKMVAK